MEQYLPAVIDITKAAGAVVMSFYRSAYDVTDKAPDNPHDRCRLCLRYIAKGTLASLLPEAGWLVKKRLIRRNASTNACSGASIPSTVKANSSWAFRNSAYQSRWWQTVCPHPGRHLQSATGELYSAAKGNGFTFNGKPHAVSDRRELLPAPSSTPAARNANGVNSPRLKTR